MKRWKDIFNPHFTFFIIHTGIKQKQEPTRNNVKNKSKKLREKTSISAYNSFSFYDQMLKLFLENLQENIYYALPCFMINYN